MLQHQDVGVLEPHPLMAMSPIIHPAAYSRGGDSTVTHLFMKGKYCSFKSCRTASISITQTIAGDDFRHEVLL